MLGELRKMRVLMMLALLSCGVSAPALAADEPAEDKRICKRDRSFDTGSHLSKPRKICMKASEWRELEQESQRNIDRLRDRRGVDPDGPASFGGAPG